MATRTPGNSGGNYRSVTTADLGSWDPEQNDAAPESNRFYVVKNLRQEHPGSYTVRSGYKATLIDADTDTTVYATEEYEVHGVSFAATLFYDASDQKVYCAFYNKVTEAVTETTIVASGIATAPDMVCAMQYQTYFIVSIYERGVFAVYPADDSFTVGWTVRELGKELAITPNFRDLRFADDTSGDLIVYFATNDNHTAKYEYVPGKDEPSKLRMPIGAKYWLGGGSKFSRFDATNLKLHEWSGQDPTDTTLQTDSIDHLATNGWGYKVVFVHELTDTKGNKYTWRSNPSVDFWAPNMNYVPAYNKFNGTGAIITHPNGTLIDNIAGRSGTDTGAWRDPRGIGDPGDQSITIKGAQPWRETTDELTIEAVPDTADLYDLQKAFRRYFNSFTGFNNKGGTEDPYHFASLVLGWLQPSGNGSFVTDSHFNLYPYKVPVGAYELKRAPMLELTWNDFAQIPTSPSDGTPIPNPDFAVGGRFADVIKIEIYRTAYNKGTDKDNNPLFGYHLYGYVGTLEKNAKYLDDVADEAIDFGKSPDRHEGYLKGQLTGKVIREYNTKVVLGNIETEYEVFPPSVVQQAFAVQSGLTPGFATTLLTTIEADGYPTRSYHYQYLDAFGNASDLTYVKVDTTDTGSTYTTIAFRVPHGYNPNIQTIRIVQGIYSGGVRTYSFQGDVGQKQGWFIWDWRRLPAAGVVVQASGNTKLTVEEGAVAWSEGNAIFAYPFRNIEIIHKFAPVTAMETLLGPLWVWTDRSVDLTVLSIDKPRGEEETKHVGNIGFHTFTKTNKVVFFLSAFGLYYAEASGVVAFPAYLQSVILQYLKEKIDGQPDLANAKRASIGWLGRRGEMWLHFPSSVDLGGSLPARTLIYRFFEGEITNMVNYEFELTNSLDYINYPEITRPVVMRGHTDGSLFSAHLQLQTDLLEPNFPAIMLLDNDRTEYEHRWLGQWNLEQRYSFGSSNFRKKLREVAVRIEGQSKINVVTGSAYQIAVTSPGPGIPDYSGGIYQGARRFEMRLLGGGQLQTLKHRINGMAAETTSYTPCVRYTGEPDILANNDVTIYETDAFFVFDGAHP